MEPRLNLLQNSENRLLATLSAEEYNALQPHLEMVENSLREEVQTRNQAFEYVYFPCTSVFSVIATMRSGAAVEVGTIGSEGFIGIELLMGGEYSIETTICQIVGKSLRMPVADFKRAIDGNTPLRRIAQRFIQAYLSLVSQSVACNRLHTIDERFARWILMTHDRVIGNEFYLTQEFLAIMLGVHRPSVTVIAHTFQQSGLIRYTRGKFTILDRKGMEEASCECYSAVRLQFERFLGAFNK
ncbi:MAG: Crp/Fnr family transcriptional regulator [Herminiimonas sp.]|nr:Crp/Fnr family transcriptional regulator [Herminiimonas sp.]